MQTNQRLWNIKEIAERTIAVCYFGNPNLYVFTSSAEKTEVYDPTFECFGQMQPSKHIVIPASETKEASKSLTKDYYAVQSFTDNLNTGLGYYMPRYLTQKLIEQNGYAMLCLKMDENWAQTSENLVQVFLFNKDCNLKSGQEEV